MPRPRSPFFLFLCCLLFASSNTRGFVIQTSAVSKNVANLHQQKEKEQNYLLSSSQHQQTTTTRNTSSNWCRPKQRPSIMTLPSKRILKNGGDDDHCEDNVPKPSSSFRRHWRKKLRKYSQTLLLASVLSSAIAPPKAAYAKFSHELQEERTLSLRPGMTQNQATAVNQGEIPDDIAEPSSTLQTLQDQQQQQQNQKPEKKKKEKAAKAAKRNSFDYGDEDDDDDDGGDFDDFLDSSSSSTPKRNVPGTRTSVTKSDLSKAANFQASTKSQFSGMGPKSDTQSKMLTLKVSIGLFIPTWGAMGVREFVRRRKEEQYVKKGLEILEAQKAEYFNITETTPDSDIEDELKDLKDSEDDDDENEEEEDDDDDDDDDEDEDDEPPTRRSPKPKRPSGGPTSGGDGSSSGDGGGRPSEDDLKRLGDIFNKS